MFANSKTRTPQDPTRAMWMLPAAALLIGISSCAAAPPATGVAAPAAPAQPVPAVTVQAPAPPGVSARLVTPLTGEKLERAERSLEDVVAKLDKPKYARVEVDEDEPRAPAEPPFIAQQSYLKGRVAMTEGKRFTATRHFENARRLAPNAPQPLRMLAKSNPSKAVYYLTRALVLNPRDLESAFELGRRMIELRRWTDAVAAFDHVRSLRDTPVDTDPSRWPLVEFYQGTALQSGGFDSAAIACWMRFVDAQPKRGMTVSLAYHLALANRQRGLIWRSIGDAHHRLGNVQDALAAYRHAADDGVDDAYALVARVAYSMIRAGSPEAAHQSVMKHFGRLDQNPNQIALVMYLTRHGVDGARIADQLKPLYLRQGRPTRMALLLAELRGPRDGAAILREHLKHRPTDHDALAALVDMRLSENASLGELVTRCADAVDAIAENLQAAKKFARIMVDRADDQGELQEAIDALPAEQKTRSAVQYIRAVSLMEDGRLEQARRVLEACMEGDSPPAAARIALARLLIENQAYDQVRDVLKPLEALQSADVVALQAEALAHTDDLDKAIELLDRAIDEQEDDVVSIVTKARLQRRFDDAATAERTLLDALTTRPEAELIYIELFDLYDAAGPGVPDRDKQWTRLMWRMLRAIPHSRVARLKSAEWELVNKNYAPAETSLRQLLDEDAADYEALDALLEVLVETDRKPESEKLLDKALDNAPDHRELRSIALRHYVTRLNKAEKAEGLLREVVQEQPDNLEALDQLLQVLVLTDRQDESVKLLDGRLKASPDDLKLAGIAANHFQQRLKDQDRADPLWERLLLAQPESTERDYQLSDLYIRQGRPREAAELSIKAIGRGDTTLRVHLYQFGVALQKIDDTDQRDKLARDAISRLPKHEADLWFFWAMAYEIVGEHERAEKMMEQLLAKFPSHPDTNNSLGYMWTYQGKNLERARKMIEKAVNGNPKSAAYLDSLGWVHYKLGNFDKAVLWLKRAKAADTGGDSIILDHVGDALYRTGKRNEALRAWKLAKRKLNEDSQTSDPERLSLPGRLDEKIDAAQAKGDVPVASVPSEPDAQQPSATP